MRAPMRLAPRLPGLGGRPEHRVALPEALTLTDVMSRNFSTVCAALERGDVASTPAVTVGDELLHIVARSDWARAVKTIAQLPAVAPVSVVVNDTSRRPLGSPADVDAAAAASVAVYQRRADVPRRLSRAAACIVRPDDGDVLRAAVPVLRTSSADLPFPIDIVYTWVDDADPAWLERKRQSLAALGREVHQASIAEGRFKNRDELKYSLRSVAMFAPWVNHIYVVTDDQVPSWLDTGHPKIDVVSHRDIFADPSALPVFNSHAIESQLHHIDGLSEHYLYMNDDFLFTRPVRPELFFFSNGIGRFFPSNAQVPLGPPSLDDKPVDAAAKNGRRLLYESCGRTVTQKFKHTPQPQQRSVLYELEERFSSQFKETAASTFRQPSDFSIPSSLHHHYAYLVGRAVPGTIRYRYIALADDEDLYDSFGRLLERRDADSICLNDADVPGADTESVGGTLAEFFERYYPIVSPWEMSAR